MYQHRSLMYRLTNPHADLTQPLTIRAKAAHGRRACLPEGMILPARHYLWYYAACWPDGSPAATLHLGEGILMAGCHQPWRIVRHNGVRTLLMPTSAGGVSVASLFTASAGLFERECRVTLGDSRIGGYDLAGNGWRGGLLRRASDGARLLTTTGEGDPPDVYHMTPVSGHEPIPLSAALLIAYTLTEREVQQGSWVKRPHTVNASPALSSTGHI